MAERAQVSCVMGMLKPDCEYSISSIMDSTAELSMKKYGAFRGQMERDVVAAVGECGPLQGLTGAAGMPRLNLAGGISAPRTSDVCVP